MENKETMESIKRHKSHIFKNINKIDKPLGKVIKKERRHKEKLFEIKII